MSIQPRVRRPSPLPTLDAPPSSGMRKATTSDTRDIVPTQVAARFMLKREIGRGGMCRVYKAEHRYTRRSVALKMLLPEVAQKPESQARLLREAVALGRIRHDNVLQVLDAGVSEGNVPFIALELMDGRTLEGVLASQGTLSVGDAVHVARRVAAGIDAAHRCGIIHRDVKPGNVFIVRGQGSDGVKLGDFGLAYVPSEDTGAPKLTGHGIILGTPEYMSPEQLMSMPITPRSDVWALGILLHECLTGTVPYVGNYYDVLLQASTATGPVVTEVSEEIPAPLASIINRALSKEGNDRINTAAEFIAALDATGLASERLRILNGAPAARRASIVDSMKRARERAPYVTPVRIDCEDGTILEGRCENISLGGVMLFAERDVPVGAAVKIRFGLPGSGLVATCSATVRWTRRGDGNARHRFTMGLEFFYLDPSIEAEIKQYVELMRDERNESGF